MRLNPTAPTIEPSELSRTCPEHHNPSMQLEIRSLLVSILVMSSPMETGLAVCKADLEAIAEYRRLEEKAAALL